MIGSQFQGSGTPAPSLKLKPPGRCYLIPSPHFLFEPVLSAVLCSVASIFPRPGLETPATFTGCTSSFCGACAFKGELPRVSANQSSVFSLCSLPFPFPSLPLLFIPVFSVHTSPVSHIFLRLPFYPSSRVVGLARRPVFQLHRPNSLVPCLLFRSMNLPPSTYFTSIFYSTMLLSFSRECRVQEKASRSFPLGGPGSPPKIPAFVSFFGTLLDWLVSSPRLILNILQTHVDSLQQPLPFLSLFNSTSTGSTSSPCNASNIYMACLRCLSSISA